MQWQNDAAFRGSAGMAATVAMNAKQGSAMNLMPDRVEIHHMRAF
jgi:hypothetical protein